jgi:hypothetical protein
MTVQSKPRRKSSLRTYDNEFARLSKEQQRDVLSLLYRFLFRGDAQGGGEVRPLPLKKRKK